MNRPQLVLATHNPAKVAELRSILAGLDLTLYSAADVELPDVEETGTTFESNALLKARAGTTATGVACVADDSGLVVDALDGAPGIYSARYAQICGQDTTGDRDRANLRCVLDQLRGATEGTLTARFVCAAVLATPEGHDDAVTATLEGRLTLTPRGSGGFGYDPIFVPQGHELTTAEMSAEEKHAISHRGKAFRRLRAPIAAYVTYPPGVCQVSDTQ